MDMPMDTNLLLLLLLLLDTNLDTPPCEDSGGQTLALGRARRRHRAHVACRGARVWHGGRMSGWLL